MTRTYQRLSHPPETVPGNEDEEVGFLHLGETGIYLHEGAEKVAWQGAGWMGVKVPAPHYATRATTTPESGIPDHCTGKCPHCHLVLMPNDDNNVNENNNSENNHNGNSNNGDEDGTNAKNQRKENNGENKFFTLAGAGPRFDGTVTGAKSDLLSCACKGKRDDAALLVGLALTCQDFGHIRIRNLQIHLTEDAKASREEEFLPSSSMTKCRANIVITYSMPSMAKTNQKVSRSLSRRQPRKRRLMSESSKPLPLATQLLLSMTSCSWETYSRLLENPTNKHIKSSNKTDTELFAFPESFSLEEVYKRIGTSPFLSNATYDEQSLHDDVALTSLPTEMMQQHLVPFLRARTLESLRRVCKHFYTSLRSAVPGLRLRLYTHQVNSLSWMRECESRDLYESDMALGPTANTRFVLGGDDIHRACSGGASVVLRPKGKSIAEAIRISQFTGREISIRSDDPLSRRPVARGGLLCDDPGLGKTVTVIALILQTLGLSTEPIKRETPVHDDEKEEGAQNPDERIFNEYWNQQVMPEFRCVALNKLLNLLLRSDDDSVHFMKPVDPERDGCEDYFLIIKKPICVKDIQRKINNYVYEDFKSFYVDVKLCFENAMTYNPAHTGLHQVASCLDATFERLVVDFKANQVSIAKKSFGRPSSRPSSAVSALVAQNSKEKFKKSLVQSSGTLLVVPSVLQEHWKEQFHLHVDTDYCTNKVPVTYEFTGTDASEQELKQILRECKTFKTHFPFIFIDKSPTKKLPAAHHLAAFSVVITTTQRFTNEWKNGSFEEELRNATDDDKPAEDDLRLQTEFASAKGACPLLKVNWLRMVVDEGHSMGRARGNSSIGFASWVSSERRWAMTGTPTRQTTTQNGLVNILNLMQYLQHGFFSRQLGGGAVWQDLIARGWSRGSYASFFRLTALLKLLMVRHTKTDIAELPPPTYHTTALPMSAEEVHTYNALVCAIQSNLLITSMEGEVSGEQDSLLHRSQSKHAKKALSNIRLVCSGGTQVVPTLSRNNRDEFMRLFSDHSPDTDKWETVMEFLDRSGEGGLSPCACCGMMLPTLLVFPCGDLVCTECAAECAVECRKECCKECADTKSNHCVVCDERFNIDAFQLLQPGMDYQWAHNVVEEAKGNKQKVTQADNDDSNDSNDNNANDEGDQPAQLLPGGMGVLAVDNSARPDSLPNKPGDGHTCRYSPRRTDGRCLLCWKEHDECNLLPPCNRCRVCYRRAEYCPVAETKPSYVVRRLLDVNEEAAKHRRIASSAGFRAKQHRPPKVIVFSQFRQVLNTTGDRLLKRFGTRCVAEYWGMYRKQELQKFTYDKECFCMLLGRDGSEGLDLSFVTHIIFLEQVWDKALYQQAVARAWRMGATGSVQVETLVAENSVEETMRLMEESTKVRDDFFANETKHKRTLSSLSGTVAEYQQAKLRFLLKSLKLVTSECTLPSRGTKRKPAEFYNRTTEHETGERDTGERDQEEGDTAQRPRKQQRVRFQV